MTKLIVVVHTRDCAEAVEQATVALSHGAYGVFLINHGASHRIPLAASYVVADRHPNAWIGVNLLGLSNDEAIDSMKNLEHVRGLWCDNAHIHDDGTIDTKFAESFAAQVEEEEVDYFGGFAFKYQKQPNDLIAAAKAAVPFVKIITTSGPGTGRAANLDKIRTIRHAIGAHPLAIASGIDPQNVKDYVAYVDYMLVATGISESFYKLNPAKLDLLLSELE